MRSELKAKNPAAFKSSARAQKIVAYSEQAVKWHIALSKESIRAFENRPPALRDLSIADDRKRKPKERLAAIDRFSCAFGGIPNKVAITLFRWLDAEKVVREVRTRGKEKAALEVAILEAQRRKIELKEALDTVIFTLKHDPKTGELVEADGRGQKRKRITQERLLCAARRQNEGISQGEMAHELFPGLPEKKAYQKTRELFFDYRYEIELLKHHLARPIDSSRPARSCR